MLFELYVEIKMYANVQQFYSIISLELKMLETRFKNCHVQWNQLYHMKYTYEGGPLIMMNMVSYIVKE